MLFSFYLFIAIISFLPLNFCQKKNNNDEPVFLVPGIWSSKIYASLGKNSLYQICFGKEKILAWLDSSHFQKPNHFQCMMNILALKPNNNQNVKMEIGKPLSDIEYLGHNKTIPYYNKITEMLRKRKYTNIHSLAYDFRFVPEGMREELFPVWRQRILDEKKRTNKKVIWICHSMGCKMSSEFFIWLGKDLCEKNIKSVYMFGGALAGSVNAILALVKGYTFGLKDDKETLEAFRKLAHFLPSTYYLLPSNEYFKKAFVQLANGTELGGRQGLEQIFNYALKNFNSKMFNRYLTSINYHYMKELLTNVPTHCLYGVDVKTKRFRDRFGKIRNSNGDGVVNIESLRVCKLFAHSITELSGETHSGILQTKKSMKAFNKVFERPASGKESSKNRIKAFFNKFLSMFTIKKSP